MQLIKSTMSDHSLVVSANPKSRNNEVSDVSLLQKIKNIATNDKILAKKDIPAHEIILNPWFRGDSLGYIFGIRGSGKTWLAWKMAISISKGEDFGPWPCKNSCKTLYLDGEMTLKAMQERLLLLNSEPSGNLLLLSHELLPDKENVIFNFYEKDQQDAILEYCSDEQIKVVFMDNLSCLCFGMKENEADSWENMLGWLLKFRRSGIAVVIVHHANRDGNDMRGTSRREDAASWVIKISPTNEFAGTDIGTSFTTVFTKNRDDYGKREKSMDWTFITTNEITQVSWRETDTRALVYDMISNGGRFQ